MDKKNLFFAALLMTSATFTACSGSGDDIVSDNDIVNDNGTQPQVYTLTIPASKGSISADTRALSFPDDQDYDNATNILSKWTAFTDKIKVYKSSDSIAAVSPSTSERISPMSGTLRTATPLAVGDQLNLYYPAIGTGGYSFYLYQDGKLGTISNYYDYSKAEAVEIAKKDGTDYTTKAANFVNQQAIVRFKLYQSDGTTPIKPKYLYISGENDSEQPVAVLWENILSENTRSNHGSGEIVMKLDETTNVIYAALRGLDSPCKVFLLAETDGGGKYYFSKENVTFEHGKFYRITVRMMTQAEISASGLTGTVYDFQAGFGDDPDPGFMRDSKSFYSADNALRKLLGMSPNSQGL